MPSPPKKFDVWLVVANTVYKGVPYEVVAGWAREGRIGPADNLRAAGTADPWQPAAKWESIADYLPRAAPAAAPVAGATVAAAPEVEHDPVEDEVHPRRKVEEDDDVDMIPLIDISMVLLVFFIIMRAAGALAPIDVPDMRYGGELSKDADAITISIEKAGAEGLSYSVRSGPNPAKSEHSGLADHTAALAALEDLLKSAARPPEVRIACQKDLPSERVFEISRELKKKFFDKGLINSTVATVNEAPPKQ